MRRKSRQHNIFYTVIILLRYTVSLQNWSRWQDPGSDTVLESERLWVSPKKYSWFKINLNLYEESCPKRKLFVYYLCSFLSPCSIVFAITTPFLAASLVETVQVSKYFHCLTYVNHFYPLKGWKTASCFDHLTITIFIWY